MSLGCVWVWGLCFWCVGSFVCFLGVWDLAFVAIVMSAGLDFLGAWGVCVLCLSMCFLIYGMCQGFDVDRS